MIRRLEPDGQWDQCLILDLLEQVDHTSVNVTVIPGRYWAEKIDEINGIISQDEAALLIITGDEECLFDASKIVHPNKIIYRQTPHTKDDYADRYIPIGYPQGYRAELAKHDGQARPLRYFFSGQATHTRRRECVQSLSIMQGGLYNATDGFTQGFPLRDYATYIVKAQTVPCPSGAVVQESFRVWEALEAGAVPLVDGRDPNGGEGYWNLLLGKTPFPLIYDWKDLPGTSDYFVDTYPTQQNRLLAWWQDYKWQMKQNLKEDIHKLLKQSTGLSTGVTVLIPTSPIADHPDTKHIDQTIASIRYHLPNAQIIVMIDGCREEQKNYQEKYDLYVNRLLWKTNHIWNNVLPMLFNEHLHQAEMTRQAVKKVDTTTLMFAEHDTPLVVDYEIPFSEMIDTLDRNELDVIRLLHEADIHPEHQHLMIDVEPIDLGIPILRTGQWSQRPHIARTEYYRDMIDTYFTDKSSTMIEDRIHGITQQAWLERGIVGWNEHRIGVYAPEGNKKRSYTTDGRGNDEKFEMVF